MPRPAELATLEKRYAQALGHYERAAHARETLVGMKALRLSAKTIEERRAKYLTIMEDIATAIRRTYPGWTAGHIHPIYVSERVSSGGLISRLAFSTLRDATGPMTTAEIATRVAVELEIDQADHRAMKKLAFTIQQTLSNRAAGAGLVEMLDGEPARWRVKPLPAAEIDAAARSLAIEAKPARRLPRPRSSETVDRC